MKYLINPNFTVSQKGKAVSTSKLAEDFIYDTKGEELSIASMKEIAKENGFKVKGKKTADVKNSFDTELEKLDIPEKRKMSQTEAVNKIVKAGFDEDKNEDDILIEIVQSGVKFQQAIKMLKQAKVELGLAISAEDRWKKSNVIMEDEGFEPSEYSEVTEMVKAISKDVANTNEKQALAMIRKFCKANELEIPKKPKATGASFAVKAMAWMFGNMEAEADAFEEWLEEAEKGEKVIERQLKIFADLKAEIAATE